MRSKVLFGVCILLLMIMPVSAEDISSFPGMFIKKNRIDAIIVVGKHAHAEDVIGAVDIALALQNAAGTLSEKSIAVLDTHVDDITAQNMIVVGGPCANAVAAKLLNFPQNCMQGFEIGEARIKLFEHGNGKIAMLVAGATARDTRTATAILADYKNQNLKGKEILIEIIEYKELGVEKP